MWVEEDKMEILVMMKKKIEWTWKELWWGPLSFQFIKFSPHHNSTQSSSTHRKNVKLFSFFLFPLRTRRKNGFQLANCNLLAVLVRTNWRKKTKSWLYGQFLRVKNKGVLWFLLVYNLWISKHSGLHSNLAASSVFLSFPSIFHNTVTHKQSWDGRKARPTSECNCCLLGYK